jgi:anti-sigma B factor antagonist
MATDRSNPAAARDGRSDADDGTNGTDGPPAVEVVTDDERITVVVRGDVDVVAAPALRETLADVIDRAPVTVRIDMAEVDFLDSVGISVLVASFNRAVDGGVGFELSSVPPSSRRVLEITRLTDVLTILD